MSMEPCRAAHIPFVPEAAAGSTGTNANVVNNAAEGIPTVLWSMPIKSMHSAAEILAMEDAKALSQGVREFVDHGVLRRCSEDETAVLRCGAYPGAVDVLRSVRM